MSKLACIGAITLILLLEACGANDTLGPPIALPYTVAQVSGILLTMDRTGCLPDASANEPQSRRSP
jgi:hypothetical protein